MKKIDLGQTLTILANVGVLIGILLLVYELSQNRQMMRAQTRNAIAETLINLRFNDANSAELNRIDIKASLGEELTRVELAQFRALWSSYFRYWENVYYQYRSGLYDETEYFPQRETWRRILLSSGAIRDFFCTRSGGQSIDFEAEIAELLGEDRCE